MTSATPQSGSQRSRSGFLILLCVLVVALGFLFRLSFAPDMVLFSNDGPLGALKSNANKMPEPMLGNWQDLNWVGMGTPSSAPNFSSLLLGGTSPEMYLKLHAPLSLLLLGISAWLFFRQLGFSPVVCILGGIAAALNMNSGSNAAWGQISRALSMAAAFLAMAAILSSFKGKPWVKIALAGLAVGFGVTEGLDVGALYSLYVAAFAIFVSFLAQEKSSAKATKGIIRVAIIGLFSALIAAHTVNTLVSTALKAPPGSTSGKEDKQAQWGYITQWSLPKLETLRVIIPGLFGYRMEPIPPGEPRKSAPDGSQYWGRVGETPGAPGSRFSGSGEYAGVMVVLVALFAVVQSLRKTNNHFTAIERKHIWFWGILAVISLILGWGKYAEPFYRLIYPLPFFSSMRNPMKFMHPFHMAVIILFGFGLQALFRGYVENVRTKAATFGAQYRQWWKSAASIDHKWVVGCVVAAGVSLLGFLAYSAARPKMEAYLQSVGIEGATAGLVFRYSMMEVLFYLVFLIASIGVVVAVMSGWFSGQRAKWAGILIGIILVVDLARANMPWIIYWNAKEKYATNGVLDLLRDDPLHKRVTIIPAQLGLLQSVYGVEWLQQQFQYYNIQSIDIIQDPRPAPENLRYRSAFAANYQTFAKQWQLTNTRLLFGMSGQFVEMMNQQFDPVKHRFKLHTAFEIVPKPGVTNPMHAEDFTAVIQPNGRYALIEFTGALPRMKLYSNWKAISDDEAALNELLKPDFDPEQLVIINDTSVPPPTSPGDNAGTVDYSSYKPKHLELAADVTKPAVLLLNDKHDPNWKVWVDGTPAKLLKANFLMRGVYLEPGKHTITFKFEPSLTPFYLSMTGVILGVLLCGYLAVTSRRKEEKSASTPEPQKKT